MIKKLKKVLPLTILALSLAIVPTVSAVSYPSPSATPSFSPNSQTSGALNHSGGVNWYKYTNNTGSNKTILFNLYSPSGLNYDLVFTTYFPVQGFWTPIATVNDTTSSWGKDLFEYTIYPGATFYVGVTGHTSSDYGYSPYILVIN